MCAQEPGIQGVVLDPGGRVIPGARVECAGKAAVTELDGRFKIAGVDRCQAVVSAPGFETRSVEMSAAREAEVALSIAGVSERIVVTATRHQTTVEEAGVAASVLTRADLAERQFPMVADVLRDLPGLQVTTTGRTGGLTSVFTRGAQRTGTLFLIDGVPVNDPGGEFNLAHLTSGDMDRIEVIRGPESALFGAEAAAGVVQMFTRRGDAENVVPKGFLSYERGNFGTDAWKAGLAGGSGYRLDYSLTAGQFRTTGEFPNDDYRNTTGSANIGLRISPATQLRGVVRVEDSVVGVPGQVGYGLFDYDARETNRDSVLSLRLDDARGSHYVQQVSFGYHRMRDLYTDSRMDGPYGLAALVRDVVGAAAANLPGQPAGSEPASRGNPRGNAPGDPGRHALPLRAVPERYRAQARRLSGELEALRRDRGLRLRLRASGWRRFGPHRGARQPRPLPARPADFLGAGVPVRRRAPGAQQRLRPEAHAARRGGLPARRSTVRSPRRSCASAPERESPSPA